MQDMIYGPKIQLFLQWKKNNILLDLLQNPDNYSPDLLSETSSIINVAKYNPMLTLELSNGSIRSIMRTGNCNLKAAWKMGRKTVF